jgi:hypothetical protein
MGTHEEEKPEGVDEPVTDEATQETGSPVEIPRNLRIVRLEAEVCDDDGCCFILKARDGELTRTDEQ